MVPVERLVFHVPTRKFLRKENEWTDDPDEAAVFPDLTSVADLCHRQGLKDVELVLRFDHQTFNIRLPILSMLLNLKPASAAVN